jgi:AcrR family transcriptional regulator
MTPPRSSSSGVDGLEGGRRALRADARRNRERLLEAAEDVFAAEGTSASTEEIARRAGVGIGTLFRHFPTKEALVEAIVLARVGRLVEEADALAAEGDPATAFFEFFTRTVEEAEAKKTYSELLAGGFVDVESAAPELRRRLRRAIEALLTRAQEAGTLRDDVGVAEVMTLLVGAVRAAEHAGEDADLRTRTVGILLDGLHPAQRD